MGALFVFVYFICLLLFSAAYVTYAIYSQAGRAFSLKPCPPSPCVKSPSKPCFGFGGGFLCTAMKKAPADKFWQELDFYTVLLLPLNSCGRFSGDVIHNSVDALDLVNNSVGSGGKDIIGNA